MFPCVYRPYSYLGVPDGLPLENKNLRALKRIEIKDIIKTYVSGRYANDVWTISTRMFFS